MKETTVWGRDARFPPVAIFVGWKITLIILWKTTSVCTPFSITLRKWCYTVNGITETHDLVSDFLVYWMQIWSKNPPPHDEFGLVVFESQKVCQVINDEWVPSTFVWCLFRSTRAWDESISNSQEEVSHHFEHQGIDEFWWEKKVYAKSRKIHGRNYLKLLFSFFFVFLLHCSKVTF